MIPIITIGLFLTMINSSSNVFADKEKCEDVKGTMKWGATDHGDNNPSESKFNKMVFGKATICEVAKCYDHDECIGEITKGEWKDFKGTFVYIGTTEDVQDCLNYRYKLPDDNGKPELQAYEIKDCALGEY